jgi:DNA-binding FrmR family transcriptional regulator
MYMLKFSQITGGRYIPVNEEKAKIINRLRRIEGQVKGIAKMLETDQCCGDILVQVSAVRSAINRVGTLIFERYSYNCLEQATTPAQQQQAMSELLKTMNSFIKGGGGLDGSDR